MVAYRGEAASSSLLQTLPVVMKVQRRSMVDEVEGLVPVEEVGIARCPVDVGDEGVKPDCPRGEVRFDFISRGGIEHDGPWQIVEAQVQAHAPFEQIADLRVCLVATEC